MNNRRLQLAARLLDFSVKVIIFASLLAIGSVGSSVGQSDRADFAASDKWIALVIEYTSSDYNKRLVEGVREEANRLGLRLEVLDAKGNKATMSSMIDDVTLRNVDGILISHGLQSQMARSLKRSVRKNIPVVSIHNDLKVSGVTMLDQDDRMIQKMVMEQFAEDFGGKANFVLIWIGGFIPMDLRMEEYNKILPEYPGLKELERFGTAGLNTDKHTELTMSEILDRYPYGTIDAVIATWDEYAKGAARAMMKKNRGEIRLYGIDISKSVVEMLQDDSNPWQATVGVDSKALGKMQVQMISHAIMGNPLPSRHTMKPVLVTKAMLPEDREVQMSDLHKYVPGWDDSSKYKFSSTAEEAED